MPIINMNDLLEHAYTNDYAVGSFDIVNLDFLKGIIQAAEQTGSPVILSLSESNVKHSDIEILMPAIEASAKKTFIPVAIQFTNCTSLDLAIKAINLGFNGIMINASNLSIQNNFSISSEVVKMAHGCGVSVEGKLSFFPVTENKNPENYLIEKTYNTLLEIRDYVKKSGIDFLNVAIKTIHASKSKNSKLDFQQLKEINETLGIPLSIDGSMDFSEDQYCHLVANGVSKIDFNTSLSDFIIKQSMENTGVNFTHNNKFLKNITSVITKKTKNYMLLLKSSNRASDVMTHCNQWTLVEHLIIYNVEGIDKNEALSMITEGQRVLSNIPGVREVFTGEAVHENASYRYTWLVRFCHISVIDSYRIHPDHIAFADKLFRPVAGERISIDYQQI